MVELVDTQDLKSCRHQQRCGFKSRLGHFSFFLLFAEIAQLVERNLAKVEVAGSSLVFRSVVCTKTPSFKNKLGVFLFYVIVLIIA